MITWWLVLQLICKTVNCQIGNMFAFNIIWKIIALFVYESDLFFFYTFENYSNKLAQTKKYIFIYS